MSIAPRLAILGFGRLAEALTERLVPLCDGVRVFTRHPPSSSAITAAFFTDVNEALDGARFVLAVTSDYASIMEILQSIDSFEGQTFIQISTLSPSQSVIVEKEVVARRGRYIENPVLGSRPEARKGTLIAMAGPAAAIDDDTSALIGLYSNKRVIFNATGQASALKLIFNFLIGALTASFSVALATAQENAIEIEAFMGLLRESALYAPTFDKKLDQMLSGAYANPNFPAEHLKKDLSLFAEVAHLSLLAEAFIGSLSDIATASADRQKTKLDYSSLFEIVKDS